MKNALVIVAVLLCATSAFADDGTVSSSALDALGLGQMQVMSDAQGMEVRGMSGANAFALGASLGASQLLDIYQPGNFAVGTDTNTDRGSDENLAASVFSGVGTTTSGATNVGTASSVLNTLDTSALIGGVLTPSFTGTATITAGGTSAVTVP